MPGSFHPLTIAISFAAARVILSFAFPCEPGRARCVVTYINPAPTQMIDGAEKPKILSKFAKRAARYNEFGCRGLIMPP